MTKTLSALPVRCESFLQGWLPDDRNLADRQPSSLGRRADPKFRHPRFARENDGKSVLVFRWKLDESAMKPLNRILAAPIRHPVRRKANERKWCVNLLPFCMEFCAGA